MQYDLENLSELFDKHAKEQVRSNKNMIERFKQDYPDQDLPDHFKNDFSLPLALKCLVDEILELKNRLYVNL